jgi:hypothetical protein
MTKDLPGSSTSRYWLSISENSTASNWPDESEKTMMPILLPVRVLRSCLEITVPARRALVAPCLTAAEKSAKVWTRILAQHVAVGIERMGGEVEAQDLELLEQLFRCEPRRKGGSVRSFPDLTTPAPNISLWPLTLSAWARCA